MEVKKYWNFDTMVKTFPRDPGVEAVPGMGTRGRVMEDVII